jgi:hypothetical protein
MNNIYAKILFVRKDDGCYWELNVVHRNTVSSIPAAWEPLGTWAAGVCLGRPLTWKIVALSIKPLVDSDDELDIWSQLSIPPGFLAFANKPVSS